MACGAESAVQPAREDVVRARATSLALGTIIGLITLAIIIGLVWTTLPGTKH